MADRLDDGNEPKPENERLYRQFQARSGNDGVSSKIKKQVVKATKIL